MDDWAQRQRHAAEQAVARERHRQQAETARAQVLVDDFVVAARERGLATTRLVATPYSGRGSYRTDVEGWYVRRDHSLAVGADGGFYVLSVPASLAGRLRGVHLRPSDPPLVAGRGARDGQSMDLRDLLAQRLAAGDAF